MHGTDNSRELPLNSISDEHITIAQCLRSEGTSVSAVIVTTPQEVALIDVRKEINFCKKVRAYLESCANI